MRVRVPYKGTAGAVTDTLGGQINLMFLPIHVAAIIRKNNITAE